MGKRGSRSQSQLLNTLTKKQKKHLRDFGEEHPFYDKYEGHGGPELPVAFPGGSARVPGLGPPSPASPHAPPAPAGLGVGPAGAQRAGFTVFLPFPEPVTSCQTTPPLGRLVFVRSEVF